MVHSVQEYNAKDLLSHLGYTQGLQSLADYTWTYDALERLTQATSPDGTASYTYDNADQLISVNYTGSQSDESYSYGANGNRQSANDKTYVTGGDNRILSDGTYNYSYDAEGNRTERVNISTGAKTDYCYDLRNRLTSVTDKTADDTVTQVVTYTYDAENRLVSETITPSGGTTETIRFIYDGNDVVLQMEGSGTAATQVTDRYLWNDVVDQLLADEKASSGNALWTLADNQGSVRDIATYNLEDDITTIANHIVYNSYGSVASQTNATVSCAIQYTGQYHDAATGLQYNLNRWYDPNTGSWISQDPIGFGGGDPNLYRYCGNSPTNGTDPSGLADTPSTYTAQERADMLRFLGHTRRLSNTDALQAWSSRISSPSANTAPIRLDTPPGGYGSPTAAFFGSLWSQAVETDQAMSEGVDALLYCSEARSAFGTAWNGQVEALGQRYYNTAKAYGYSDAQIADESSMTSLAPSVFGDMFATNYVGECWENYDFGLQRSMTDTEWWQKGCVAASTFTGLATQGGSVKGSLVFKG